MKNYTGFYDMETIKHWSLRGISIKVDCPECGGKSEFDAGDRQINYPSPQTEVFKCKECALKFGVIVTIEIPVIINVTAEVL